MDKDLRLTLLLTLFATVGLAACGGGDSTTATAPAPAPAPAPPPTANSVTAATATANNNPDCISVRPFYWEIGDQSGAQASGSIPSDGQWTATSPMNIASASKWLYSSYVLQQHNGPQTADIPFLNFTSGYSTFGQNMCSNDLGTTVQACLDANNGNSPAVPSTAGLFDYDSGHMEYHAANAMNLGSDVGADLKTAILDPELGTANALTGYTQPLLAGGVFTDASSYAVFLRQILSGSLVMKDWLGTNKVCTNPDATVAPSCGPTLSAYSPVTTEAWNYSLGHWVEDDPNYGDHAFSSAGALGFYPWIDSTKSYYGILAREQHSTSFEGFQSAECGRLIRQAWRTGVEVTATVPDPSAN